MVVTLSDANFELSDSDNEKKGKFIAFIAFVDLEKVTVETDLVCSSKDELDEEATCRMLTISCIRLQLDLRRRVI
jgi:hypothetical protein